MESNALAFTRIFAVSFLVLFCEIMSMRWLGMELRVLRAFPNLIVIISLVATSAGLLTPMSGAADKRKIAGVIGAFLFVFACVIASKPLKFFELSIKSDHPVGEICFATLLLLSLTGCLYYLFRFLGQLLAAEFGKLAPIKAYSSNLLGSIAGVATIMVISWLCMPPFTWLLILGAVLFFLYKRPLILGITAICACIAAYFYAGDIFSPYSKLTIVPVPTELSEQIGKDSFVLNSNNMMFNSGININKADKFEQINSTKPEVQVLKHYMSTLSVPIAIAPSHDDVLILGEGSGNDVAYALKQGAKHVDGVEIDPVIAKIGLNRHPNRPLADPRATIFNEDARTFLKYSKRKYDLANFAFLDTGNTVDSASLVRVDNFVYTKEAIQSVLNHLKPNGMATLVFTCPKADSFIYQRLYKTVSAAIGKNIIAYLTNTDTEIIIAFGPGARPAPPSVASRLKPYPPTGVDITEKPTTDDWPFLYLAMEPAGLMYYCLILLVAVVLPAALMIGVKGDSSIAKTDWGIMFFLGQGFMLVETKSITQLSLLYGATWLVSSIVILFVLIFAYCANLIASSREFKNLTPLYIALAAALLTGYFWQPPVTSDGNPLVSALATTAIACLPILFGSMIFSLNFKKASNNSAFLSANLVGVAIGGLTENICMFNGIKSLSLVAMLIYGLSYICWLLGQKSKAVVPIISAPD